jgi:beta-glucanase (GH16 family)
MHYTSWQIMQKTAPFLYGTIEVREKLPGGTGLWPTFFLLGYKWQASQPFTANTPEANGPHDGWCEIDIAEFLQSHRNQVNNVVHFEVFGGTSESPLPFNATSRFMVYRLQWNPGSLVYSVDAEDGAGFRTLRTITGATAVPNVPMYITINAAVGGIGGGNTDPATYPQTYSIDWVRVTQ